MSIREALMPTCVNGQFLVPAGGQEKSPPFARSFLLNEAFHTPKDWRAFKAGVGGGGVENYDDVLTEQVRMRAKMPDHHSTGAIDEELARVREFMEPQAFCYRNAERTNRLLELVRLRLNRCDDPLIYARAIRAHLDAHDGRLGRQGEARDPRGYESLRA